MGELGTRGTTERVPVGNSPPKVARAVFLPDADWEQCPLLRRSHCSQQLTPSVIAPRKAWRLLQGASPCRVRASHPPVASLAPMAEPGVSVRRPRWAQRRQRILEAAGVTA